MSPLVSDLHLYDIANVKGVAADISHCNTPSKVADFTGAAELANCLKGVDVVVIPAGVPRKPEMTRPKAKSKKKGGVVDFKKRKVKLGRRLPPPKNSTNTEVKSKAIILPEQSVAADKAGLAVKKKGLTLKELLQQTSHHNAKVRRDALMGTKDLFSTIQIKNPDPEAHKYFVEHIAKSWKSSQKLLNTWKFQFEGPMMNLFKSFLCW